MQAELLSDSNSPGGISNNPDAYHGGTADVGFAITSHDTNILQHYLEEFKAGDTSDSPY
jgi:hypothetical protein